MSEKVTFQELIEAIAEETDNSKQFTHDFLKDFVTVINDGLEEEGSVNIAGFGKFDLKRVDEREGYNPQTEEKMTIPAHNKIVFKPYKDLRELVNAPYAHLEPELIEEEEDDPNKTTAEEGATDPEGDDETDFIPTAPPTQETESDIDEDPFDLDIDEGQEPATDSEPTEDAEEPTEQDDTDIVEFKADQDEEESQEAEEVDEGLDEFINTPDEPKEKTTSDDQLTEDETEETDSKSEAPENLEEQNDEDDDSAASRFAAGSQEPSPEEKEEKPTPTPSIREERHQKRQPSTMPIMIVAAAFILLIATGGAWYFGIVSESETNQMATETTTSTTDGVAEENDNNQQVQSGDQDQQQTTSQNQQPTAQKNQNQSQQATTATKTQNSDSETEGVTIEDGQTLWSIAEDKYGNPRLWPWIYGKNESLDNPDLILAGNSLTVPLPSGSQNNLTATDSTGVAKGFILTYHWYKNNNSSKAKDHIWAAKLYHDNIRDISDIPIDEEDLAYANRAR